MDMQPEVQGVVDAFGESLAELNTAAKNDITALSILAAEEYNDHARHIAALIETRLRAVSSKKKLPIMYLIDSICKNYPKSIYVQLFTQSIVSNFCSVFDASPERTRQCLWKLKTTWETAETFPQSKLKAIDERVHRIDSNYPIRQRRMPQRPQRQQQDPRKVEDIKPQANELDLQEPQNKKRRTGTQDNGVNSQNQAPYPSMPVFQQHATLQPNIPLDPSHLIQPISLPPQTTAMDPQHLLQMPPTIEPSHLIQTGPVEQPHLMLPLQQIPLQQQPQQLLDYKPQILPDDLDLTLDSLYGGKQCSNCSLRFDENNKYSSHLDWHYRQNLKSNSMFARKKWYYPLNLWVQFREINDDEAQETSIPDSNNVNDLLISHNDHEVPYAPASIEDEKNICPVCHETFEKFWDEDEEEWRLRNARLHDDQRVYHPPCLLDMLQASVAQ